MGQGQSTPLDLVLNPDFKSQAHSLGVNVKKGKLQILCNSEWPTFGCGWLCGGTSQKSIISVVWSWVLLPRPEDHPNQMPYILMWQNLALDPPPWLKPFMETAQILVSQVDQASLSPKAQELPPVLPTLDDPPPDLLFPPLPYAPGFPLALYPPLPPQGNGNKVLAAAGTALVPLLSPPAHHTRGHDQWGRPSPGAEVPSSTTALPVHTVGPMVPDGPLVHQYWPFISSDLYNWKHQNPPFSEQLQKFIDLVESIFLTYSPTWDNCQQLLHTLFTSEETDLILAEGWKLVLGDDRQPTAHPLLLEVIFPVERPDWDFSTGEERSLAPLAGSVPASPT
uniref:Core shell protein Gag P30 domain-containing protein n=1 Tax=Monodelphis domestica TaxID=13616 RepID=A0A5F8GVT4_MONDO